MELRNWAGNIRFSTDRVHHPETVGQVQEIVRKSRQVRVLGSRHSFNAIADSTGDLISLETPSSRRLSSAKGSRSREQRTTADPNQDLGAGAGPRDRWLLVMASIGPAEEAPHGNRPTAELAVRPARPLAQKRAASATTSAISSPR